jgi:hypothetical protein
MRLDPLKMLVWTFLAAGSLALWIVFIWIVVKFAEAVWL